jgi:hypothetical protein
MASIIPLLLAAATLGALHMSAPDHWATLTILGRIAKWKTPRLMAVGAAVAVGHVAISLALASAVVVLGLLFSKEVADYVSLVVGAGMLVGGLYYGIRELRAKAEVDLERETREKLSKSEKSGAKLGYFAVLGAALSPDLSVLPVFLLAVPLGLGVVSETALVFALAAILALMVFLLLASAGLAGVLERIPPKYSDALVGFVIAVVGLYVLLGG